MKAKQRESPAKFMDERGVAEDLGVSVSLLRKWRQAERRNPGKKCGPPWVKVGVRPLPGERDQRVVRYPIEGLQEYIAALEKHGLSHGDLTLALAWVKRSRAEADGAEGVKELR